MPIFSSFFPTEKPLKVFSIIKAVIFLLSKVFNLAYTKNTSPILPLVIYCLVPFKIYLLPFLTATVDIPNTSVPAPGSVIPIPAIHSPVMTFDKYLFLCSSLEE